jgi:hypothetical protein
MESLPRLLEGLPSIRRLDLPNCNLAGDCSYPKVTHLALASKGQSLPQNLSHTFPAISVFHLEMDDNANDLLSSLPPTTVALRLSFSHPDALDDCDFVQCFGSLQRLQRFRLLSSMLLEDAAPCDWFKLLMALPSSLLDFEMYCADIAPAYLFVHITTRLLSDDPAWVPNLQRCTFLAPSRGLCAAFQGSEGLYRLAAGKRRMVFERRLVSDEYAS